MKLRILVSILTGLAVLGFLVLAHWLYGNEFERGPRVGALFVSGVMFSILGGLGMFALPRWEKP